jgi:hypothetical protein
MRVKSRSDWPFPTGRVRRRRCAADAALASPRLTSRTPVPTEPSPMSEADHVTVRALCLCPSMPPPLSGCLHRCEPLHGERSPEYPPCRLFLRVHLRLSFLSLSTLTQDPAGHRCPHLIGERRRRPGFSTLPVGKKLRSDAASTHLLGGWPLRRGCMSTSPCSTSATVAQPPAVPRRAPGER